MLRFWVSIVGANGTRGRKSKDSAQIHRGQVRARGTRRRQKTRKIDFRWFLVVSGPRDTEDRVRHQTYFGGRRAPGNEFQRFNAKLRNKSSSPSTPCTYNTSLGNLVPEREAVHLGFWDIWRPGGRRFTYFFTSY